MIAENNIVARYGKYDDRVIDYLINITKSIKGQEATDEYYYCMFDLLVVQLHLYFTSCDQLMQLKDLTSEDNYKRLAKTPIVGILQKCHANILDIMQKLSLGQMEQAKLNRLKGNKDDESAEALIDKLIND